MSAEWCSLLIGCLAYAIPHTIYHLANDHRIGSSDQVSDGVTLLLSVALALALLRFASRSVPSIRGA